MSGEAKRINSKGQVTSPTPLGEKHGLREGDEVNVIEEGRVLPIVQVDSCQTRRQRLVKRIRGRATSTMTTDQLLQLLRDE
ncbi:MAG: AbrB/MazE/SpoVT family DNA-binding domain-containing protein [Candidatus Dormiibacterota bacterium]